MYKIVYEFEKFAFSCSKALLHCCRPQSTYLLNTKSRPRVYWKKKSLSDDKILQLYQHSKLTGGVYLVSKAINELLNHGTIFI